MSSSKVNASGPTGKPAEYIVHREDEWNIIDSEIRRRTAGPNLPKSIIVIFGTAGIGKTTFIEKTLIPRITEDYSNLPLARINFDKDFSKQRYDNLNGRGNILVDLVSQLEKSTGKASSIRDVAQKWEQLTNKIVKSKKLSKSQITQLEQVEKELISNFVQFLSSLYLEKEKRPVNIVMDTLEEVDRETIGWIQEKLQAPTTDSGYVLWIMASRQPLDCQPFFLRPRYYWLLLQPFKEQQIREQIPDHPDLASVLKRYSFGLPEATKRLADVIVEIEKEEEKQLGPTDLDEKRVADRLIISLEDLLRLHRYLGAFKGDDEKYIKQELEILSPLRLFNVAVITELLPKWLSEYFKPTTIGADALFEIQRLVRTRLVSWDRSKRGYVFEEPVRQIVALVFKHNRPADYKLIHIWAAVQYLEWAENIEQKRIDYIVEALYHKLILLELEKNSDKVSSLVSVLENLINKFYKDDGIQNEEALVELKEQLESDKDFKAVLRFEEIQRLLQPLLKNNKTVLRKNAQHE